MRFVYKSRGEWDMKERGENRELMQKESRVIFVWKRREHENKGEVKGSPFTYICEGRRRKDRRWSFGEMLLWNELDSP